MKRMTRPPSRARDLAIDLARTVLVDDEAERDLLTGPRELDRLLDAWGVDEPGLALRLADFRRLRDAVRLLLVATAERRPPAPDAFEVINDASAVAPVFRRLQVGDGPPRSEEAEWGSGAAAVFGRIARGAIDLVGRDERDAVRVCPAPGCGRPFLASGTRRTWCSTACGNRVRVARHRARASAAGTGG
jgi:predicted RNA-binding Zn ribbon-like protein